MIFIQMRASIQIRSSERSSLQVQSLSEPSLTICFETNNKLLEYFFVYDKYLYMPKIYIFKCSFGQIRYQNQQRQMDIQQDNQLNPNDINHEDIQQQHTTRPHKDIFEDMLEQNYAQKLDESLKHSMSRKNRKHIKKMDMRKILNSSSSNQKIPTSLKNDSSLQHSDRARNVFQTQNSMDQQSFRKSFKKRYEESFSVENTIRDSSSSISEMSDSKSNQNNNNILLAVYKQEEVNQSKKGGCHCKRSKCLRRYCQCFQNRRFCTQNCFCHDCGNHRQNAEHGQAVIEALARNARGFIEQQEKNIKQCNQKSSLNSFSLGVAIQQVRKGCKCRKTQCLKKYCLCYNSGVPCTKFCMCQGCQNNNSFKIKK